jgi:hypothetical protein
MLCLYYITALVETPGYGEMSRRLVQCGISLLTLVAGLWIILAAVQ